MKKLYILFLTFCTLFTPHSIHSQWVQQTLPVSGLIYDIVFFDSNIGMISMDTPALLRTTNGGTNWTVINNLRIYNFNKIDSLAVYSNGRLTGVDKIYRSFDKGITWDSVSPSSSGAYSDLAFVNRDTGWVSGFNGIINVVYRSTNGGNSLEQQSTATGFGRIFFLKNKINGEYHGWNANSYLFYTTNSGINWTQYTNLPNQNAGSIFFLNKDTGWVSNRTGGVAYIMFTSNNGNNWVVQNLPAIYSAGDIYFRNSQTGWAGRDLGKIYATTNGGVNWGTQDVPVNSAFNLSFIDSITGWCGGYNSIAKTTNGGGNIIYNGIKQIGNEVPVSFKLYQNYPNPFNPITNIKYQIIKSSHIKLVVYDILGRIITVLVNEMQIAGVYLVDWNANALPSGTYFYKLVVSDPSASSGQGFTETKKMILIK